MSPLNIVLSILLFVSAVFLVIAVLMQSGKSKGVGAISGGSSETYFGKNKGKSADKKLSLITTIVAIVFVVLALFVFVIQEAPLEDDGTTTATPGATTSTKAPNGSTGSSVNGNLSDTGNSTTIGGGSNDVQSTPASNNSGNTNPDIPSNN